jgi:hypothetical protein
MDEAKVTEESTTDTVKTGGVVGTIIGGVALVTALVAGPDYVRDGDLAEMKAQAGGNAVMMTGRIIDVEKQVVDTVTGDTAKEIYKSVAVAERKFNPLFYGTNQDTVEIICRIKSAGGKDTCFGMGEFTSDSTWLPDVSVRLQPSSR